MDFFFGSNSLTQTEGVYVGFVLLCNKNLNLIRFKSIDFYSIKLIMDLHFDMISSIGIQFCSS